MSLNVLVVEDEGSVRRAIVRALQVSGLKLDHVAEAENGEQALRLLGENHFDILLVDLNMPVVNGFEFVDRIKKNPDVGRLPVIFISGERTDEMIQIGHKKGVGFIQKPFTP